MTRIGIILGSTRPNRNGEQVAKWVLELASGRDDAEFELVDLRDYPLPHLDEPMPPSLGPVPERPHQASGRRRSPHSTGSSSVTPEYNHSTSGVLKNAIDYLYAEWNNKAVGFVSYGAVGGARAAEHLRLVAAELQMADVRQQVALSLVTEFENFSVFKPGDYNIARPRDAARPGDRLEHGARPASRRCRGGLGVPWNPGLRFLRISEI